MKIGYIRISTKEQKTQRQEILMRELSVDKLFIDKASGKSTQRKELSGMLDFVREGDAVIVESISRFARSARDFLNLINILAEKKVEFVSKKESIDTTTPSGKFMLTVFAAVAELEREYMLDRQHEGIKIAKSLGKYKGRKPKDYPEFAKLYEQTRRRELTVSAAIKRLGISKSSWYRKAGVLKAER